MTTASAGADAILRVSEIFHSIQGEGILVGTPSAFVRASGSPPVTQTVGQSNSATRARSAATLMASPPAKA